VASFEEDGPAVTTFRKMTPELEALHDWLKAEGYTALDIVLPAATNN